MTNSDHDQPPEVDLITLAEVEQALEGIGQAPVQSEPSEGRRDHGWLNPGCPPPISYLDSDDSPERATDRQPTDFDG